MFVFSKVRHFSAVIATQNGAAFPPLVEVKSRLTTVRSGSGLFQVLRYRRILEPLVSFATSLSPSQATIARLGTGEPSRNHQSLTSLPYTMGTLCWLRSS